MSSNNQRQNNMLKTSEPPHFLKVTFALFHRKISSALHYFDVTSSSLNQRLRKCH
jgi:hypothetical protein